MTSRPADSVLDAVQARLQNWNVQGTLLVAVSGGIDSVALLRSCQLLAEHLELNVHAAHFDHALRSNSSADSEWVAETCRKWNVPLHSDRRLPATRSTHIEEDARRDRYAFLEQTAQTLNCQWLATGHTANDQTETVLHHILRGTGLSGLGGIPESRPLSSGVQLIRPLLGISRQSLISWLQSQGIEWREDPTNQDQSLTRNWIRHQLLPSIRDRINPQVDAALQQLSEHARDSQSALTWAADQLRSHVSWERQNDQLAVTIDCQPIRDVPSAILTALFTQLWIEAGWPRQKMSTQHWHALTQLVRHTGHPTGHSFPGQIQARWYRGQLTISLDRQ